MALIKWSADFNTSIKKIDDQHQRLVELINELFEAMNRGKSNEVLGNILFELIKYTKMHFKTEEDWMIQSKYSGTENHLIEHQKFANQVLEFNEQFKAGNARITVQLMNFLKDWLVNHINGSDKGYVSAIKSLGV